VSGRWIFPKRRRHGMTVDPSQKRELDDIGAYIRSRSYTGQIVRDVLEVKGDRSWTVSPETSVLDALTLMAEHNIGALVVLDGEENLAGVISERDVARKIVTVGRIAKETSVREIMSSPVQTVSPEDSVSECMSLMTVGHIRHLPVMVEGKLAGLVSIGDLVKSLMSNQEQQIREYEKYIRGTYPT